MREQPMIFWIISGKNAFQTMFMLFLSLASWPMALGIQTKGSIIFTHILPGWALQGFGCCLIAGSLANLVGVWWRGSASHGVILEGVACTTLALSCAVIFLWGGAEEASSAYVGANSALAFIGVLGVAGAMRVVQLQRALREVIRVKRLISDGE